MPKVNSVLKCIAVLACLTASSCQTTSNRDKSDVLAVAPATAAPLDPALTETPFHPFTCPAPSEYAVFGFVKTAADVSATAFGLPAATKSVSNVSKKRFDILPADAEDNLQLDGCLNGEQFEPIRLTTRLPQIKSAGNTFYSSGASVLTLIFEKDLQNVMPAHGKWLYLRVPAKNIKEKGLMEALFGDPKRLKFEVAISSLDLLVMRSIKKGQTWVTAQYIERTLPSGKVMSSDFGLSGGLGFGSPFTAFLDCRVDFSPEIEQFTIGSAKIKAKGCHRYTRTSGASHDYSWNQVVIEDQNTSLPEAERQEVTLEKEALAAHVELKVMHHNFTDTLVIRMPSATYACYLGSQSDPMGGSFPADIPKNLLAQDIDRPCLVKYGDGDWQASSMVSTGEADGDGEDEG